MKQVIVSIIALLLISGCTMAQAQQTHETQPARMCTEMWCDEGFSLNLTASQWPAGAYKIDILADGIAVSCVAQLPLPACGQPAYQCSDNALDVLVMTQGCALPVTAHALGGVKMKAVPKQFSIKATLPDGTVREMSSAVESQCSFPNGEHCDAKACCSAQMTLSLP